MLSHVNQFYDNLYQLSELVTFIVFITASSPFDFRCSFYAFSLARQSSINSARIARSTNGNPVQINLLAVPINVELYGRQN